MQRITLMPKEVTFPELSTLEFGIIETYNEAIKSYNEKARNSLNIFSNKNGELAESNCFAPIVLRQYLPKNSRLATMVDLGRATEINPSFLKGFYSDTGLTLRTNGDSHSPNDLLAKKLTKELKSRGINLKNPKVIYFDALDLKQDNNSDYGLVYILNERAKLGENIFDAPELMKDNFNFKTMDSKTGIPIENKQGNRTCYTRKDSLGGFFLGSVSDVDSGYGSLVGSNDNGRVVVVSNAESVANSQIFSDYLKSLEEERNRQVAEIDKKYSEARAILTKK